MIERARALKSDPWFALLRTLSCLAASWYVAAYLYIACSRIDYAYDLEWMEGGMLEHVARVIEGKPLYVEPSIDFTPYIYAPFYYWLSALFVQIIGLGLPALRAVSLLSSLGVFFFIYQIVRNSTGFRHCGWIAIGLFAAMFVIGGAWFDIARVDSLYLCILMAAVWLLYRGDRTELVAGILLGVAFLTKQTALLMAVPLCLARLLGVPGWRRLYCTLGFVAVAGGSAVILNSQSDGWFFYYLFELPSSHKMLWQDASAFWRFDIFIHLPFICSLAFFPLLRRDKARVVLIHWASCVGFVAAAWSSRMHIGGFRNVVMPAYLFLSWSAAETIGIWWLFARSRNGLKSEIVSLTRALSAFAYLLCISQFAVLWYPIRPHLPTAADRAVGDELVKLIAEFDGPVLVPFHGHLARLAGKEPHGHQMGFMDVYNGKETGPKEAVGRSIRAALESARYAAVVVDEKWWPDALNPHYRKERGHLISPKNTFWPKTGKRVRPLWLYIRRKNR
ncbi:MAG: glycosyltransferase family 39 protein [Deltaproteobacteria bacterium]|nr:glycosyltransferase family 39 protein [Deltaproteobacteria bacterium]